jgi:hypothetical protein
MQRNAEIVCHTLREKYLNAIMRQEVPFIEKKGAETMAAKYHEMFFHVLEGCGIRYGQLVSCFGAIITSISLSLWTSPTLALFIYLIMPVFACIIHCFLQKLILGMIK